MKYETVLHIIMGEKPPVLDLYLVSLINNKLITKDLKKGIPGMWCVVPSSAC